MNVSIKISGAILLFLQLLACKKEEKILLDNETQSLLGTWYTSKAAFVDELNGGAPATSFMYDPRPANRTQPIDDNLSQIILMDGSSYICVSHRNVLSFATIGNYKNPDYQYDGLWNLLAEGKSIHFDKGVTNSGLLEIAKHNQDSLILKTSNPKQIFEWAATYGRNIAIETSNTIVNECYSDSGTIFGGTELAAFYARYKGYLEFTKDTPLEFSPYGLGVRKGAVQGFDSLFKDLSTIAPIADSCYKANYNTYFNLGYNEAKTEVEKYQFRTQTLLFYFSRFPSE